MSEAALGGPSRRAWAGPGIEELQARWGAPYRVLVTFAAMIGTVATILSATIVNVALPQVMGAFGIGQDHAQLIATAFLAAVTGTMLLNGWLVDTFGWFTILDVLLVAYTFFGIEEIGVEIEGPFGDDENDLPLETICRTIERNLLDTAQSPNP